jgi:hypothetical protein
VVAVTAALLLGLAFAGPAYAANPPITVNTTTDQAPTVSECSGALNDCAVRQAVDKANNTAGANTINIPAGTYRLTIAPSGGDDNSTGDLNIINMAGTTIVGANAATTFVEAGMSLASAIDRVFHVETGAPASISNLTIRFGQPLGTGNGGGILANGSLTLNNVVVTQNASGPTVINSAPFNGGGGVDVESTATITNSMITQNSTLAMSAERGGGVRLGPAAAAAVTISGSTINGNKSDTGGGLETEGTGPATITGSTIANNQADVGAGVAEESGGRVDISGTTISGNTASSLGGGVSEDGGGAITITRSTLHRNTATGEGGAITQQGGGPVTITQSTIDANTGSYGGAIDEAGGGPPAAPADTLTNDTITGNHAVGPPGTNVGGGGLDLNGGGTAVVVNSTISGNTTANTNTQGGNVHDDGADPLDLTNTIISGGSPANCQGADIFSSGTHGRGTAHGHNLASDSTCGLSAANGDLFPVDPKLGPLQDNDASTFTEALLPGSPAIDAANDSACPATDQRGIARPQGPHCDIGAFELVPSAASPAAATSPAAITPAPTQVALGCANRRLTLTDVHKRRGRVVLEGIAARDLIGKQVTILFDDRKTVATAVVQSNGVFDATAALPPRRLRHTNDARYLAQAGGDRSLDLKLTRRVAIDSITHRGGEVTISGDVTRPLDRPPKEIVVQQVVSCTRTVDVARKRPRRNGHFEITFAAPRNQRTATYRLMTKVRKFASSPKRFPTFSLPEPVALG